jgi:IS5 family transposase
VAWTQAGLWRRLHRAVLDRLGAQGAIEWSRAVVDAASVRAKKGAKPGAKLHVFTDASGLPLAVATSAANTHDSLALIPLVQAIPAIRSRRGPRAAPTGQAARRQGL